MATPARAATGASLTPWLCEGVEMPLVHDQQALRLYLRCLLPTKVKTGEWFEVLIGCRNEFGLWKRADFPVSEGTETVPLHVSVLSLSDSSAPLSLETEGSLSIDCSGKISFKARILAPEGRHTPSSFALLNFSVSKEATGVLRPFMPVLSPPIHVGTDATTFNGATLLDLRGLTLDMCRLLEVPSLGTSILCAESPADLGIGGRIWDSCLVMLEYLAMHRETLLQGRRCLELGSGTGMLGMCAALLGAREVCLTDLDNVCPLLSLNLDLNRGFNPFIGKPGSATEEFDSMLQNVNVKPHCWGTDVSNLEPALVDLVIMADVVYDVEASLALVRTLQALAASDAGRPGAKGSEGGGTTYLMCFRPRNADDPAFFKALAEANIDAHEISSTAVLASCAGKLASACSDVHILELIPRSHLEVL
eukprot:TRINITY_DN10244_c0_g1_i1.p1 TRINITY_DN10244_c0_g1~~TRINITY_DN10244_c0_g1_i1.p1  ORF type:complete len:431 (+),score=65.55 TRINITY_DN10244_c0_g1_i1:33-1295(+)